MIGETRDVKDRRQATESIKEKKAKLKLKRWFEKNKRWIETRKIQKTKAEQDRAMKQRKKRHASPALNKVSSSSNASSGVRGRLLAQPITQLKKKRHASPVVKKVSSSSNASSGVRDRLLALLNTS
jgi:hypothetical protein